MNERIDELAFEAGCQRHKYWDPKHPDLEGFIISQAALDKFAELIVKECARISVEADDTMTNQGEASAQAFMEHFGVEE